MDIKSGFEIAGSGVGTAVAAWKSPLFRAVRRRRADRQQFTKDWNGEPARVDPYTGQVLEAARPGALSTIATLAESVAYIKQQLTPNHGSSVLDQAAVAASTSAEAVAIAAEVKQLLEQHITAADHAQAAMWAALVETREVVPIPREEVGADAAG